MNRRDFIKKTALASAVTSAFVGTAAATDSKEKPAAKSVINIGFIGVGLRGRDHLSEMMDRSDVIVHSICDNDQNSIDETLAILQKAGKPKPKVFLGDKAFLELVKEKAIDAVMISSPWLWHSEMAIAAMKEGKYTGVEVCGGFSLDECWSLVNTMEETGSHLFFMENVCYRRDVMAVLNMVRQGLFGELLHLEGGYQHDLREVKFNDGKQPYGGGVEFGEKGFSEAKWRTLQSQQRNADLYPTHGAGPVAQMLNINKGNRFMYLTSIASKARGLHNYVVNHPKGGENHPNADVEFRLGDIVTTIIKCANGETVLLSHDTNLPRPYSLGFRVQGTNGIWMDVNKSLLIDGKTKAHQWTKAEEWLTQYDHPLWKKYGKQAEGAGHGGMDFLLDNAFVECAKRNEIPPFDVYDAATWLAITPLSEQSISTGSTPQAFPDFTRGRWTERTNTFAGLTDEY